MNAVSNNIVAERTSYIHSVDKNNAEEYENVKTPGELEGGALRRGGAPVYTSAEVLAILYQYCMIGIVYGGISA
ncbi:hypothetical protein THRCLA_23136, partial [Thraustotheca clavata]